MKKVSLFIVMGFSLLALPSCKKFIDKQKENFLLNVMTDGRWYLQTYKENDIDYTLLFSGYEFQFYKDEKVDAIPGSGSSTNGTWKGDLSNLTFTSAFSTSADPLRRLNQVWNVTDYYENAVFAEVNTSSGIVKILLVKKP